MNISDLIESFDYDAAGSEIYGLIEALFPICRSITGDGVRKSLEIIGRQIPLKVHEVPTGTRVFDWTVPKEWNIRDAYVKNAGGERVIDFKQSNLHVLNYSIPVKDKIPLAELRKHLYTLPDRPDWIPYKTSYYKENWGFCLTHNQYLALEDDDYEVVIDATLADGHLTYAECLLRGETPDEVLISTHVCHPSLANDNLSGIGLAASLAKHLGKLQLRYSYRFLFIPGTIGAITWLHQNQASAGRIKHGLVICGVGDPGELTYKKSRRGGADIDRAAAHVLKNTGIPYRIDEFAPYGYDERQYCSPGFNLPVGRLSRTPYGEYPQYHTSADNLQFVQSSALAGSFSAAMDILNILENDGTFVNRNPMCEPQLGKRGLYDSIGDKELAMLWVLNLSDGTHSLLDIAQRSLLRFDSILQAARLLHENKLLQKCRPGSTPAADMHQQARKP